MVAFELSRRNLLRGAVLLGAATAPVLKGVVSGPSVFAAAPTRDHIVAVARSQVGVTESGGEDCQPYGPCLDWCAMFVEWVWRTAGIPADQVPTSYVATDLGSWGVARGLFKRRPAGGIGDPLPGDLVIYGEPGSGTGGHVGIVASVNAGGTINTVDGNIGSRVVERTIDPVTFRSGSREVLISGYVIPAVLAAPPPAPEWGRGVGVSSWGTGRLDVFGRGPGSGLVHRWFTGGRWSGWESLGGTLTSDPAAVSWDTRRLDVFARGGEGQLVHRYFAGDAWSSWEHLGGALTSPPAVASWSPGRLDVFARGGENQLVHRYFADGRWSAWEHLGGTLTSPPAVVSWGPGRLDVFARGGEKQLVHRYFANGRWSSWEHLGGTLTTPPTVASQGPGRLDVFARGGEKQLVHRFFAGGQWSPWEHLGGTLASPPAAVSWAAGRVDVFAVDPNNRLLHRYYTGGRWASWEALGTMP